MTASAPALPSAADLAPGQVLVLENPAGRYQQHVQVGVHAWVSDEPESAGGDDAGPSPYDLLGAAIGTCVSMTLRMYVERKGWAVESIGVLVERAKVSVPGADGAPARMADTFTLTLRLVGDLTPEQRARMAEIADRCPVHRTLERGALFETLLAEA
jgi:putative redox protein